MEKNLALSRRSLLALAASSVMCSVASAAQPIDPVLVELFTSQGCSSCPPADALAAKLATDPNNIVLTFNVDYWDHLGWRDTLAKPEYSQRQYDYANIRGDGSVYTPQMIVNGNSHVVGSNKNEVQKHLAAGRKKFEVAPSIQLTEKSIEIEIPSSSFKGDATLWLMAVQTKVTQKIERGENAGKDINYTNVVRNLVPAAMWNGQSYKGSWMRDSVMTNGATKLVAVLQHQKLGQVIGLATT